MKSLEAQSPKNNSLSKKHTEVIKDLEVEFRRDERIMRYLTVKLDKHAANWAEKRRNKINAEKA